MASCWFGAAADIASRVRDLQVGRDDVHALGHLGAIDADLAAAAASLRACAVAVDAPGDDPLGAHDALRVRAFVAACCERVMREAAHAVGPGPLCSDARLARHMADLPVFIRQMRAEHDLVAQSRALLARSAAPVGEAGWSL